ncbi:glycosyltransferase family 4 protein [Chlorogloeopsis sp. ULAP01]|uniref:glycosyltransferase family 4 protein n=1 Tax=Chlorogloeopsis sp. ULAP01 TaxID=3056483 RepID=UPI0025AAFD8B|nr:glycosyltransferase family 4 protein [Chlorogloeopsis sp. ULAP01]MDM9385231.1 glycosyltransferase family 4 protein [Chlorogloeopsis sp. ULAP01]
MKSLLMVATVPETLKGFLLPFSSSLRTQGWRVDAMAYRISSSLECLQAFDRVWDIEWSRQPLDPKNLLIAPRIIQELIKQEEYDIVHVHTPVASFVTRYALRNKRKNQRFQVIYTAHGFHFYRGGKLLRNAVFLALEKLAGNWTDYLVVINREDEETAKQYKIVSPERICYMPGIGVDLNYYSPDAISKTELEQVRKELGLQPNTQLFLSVAEFTPRKRPQDVLKAFAHLNRPNTCLAFAGNGFLMEQMQSLASQLKMENQVRFLGNRQDIPTLMRAAVATVLASEHEGLPRCVMESMCMEIPVIGTDIRGTRDLLTEGCGLLVKVGDIEELAKAMAWILDHPLEASKIGKQGRERMSFYDIKHIIKLHESLYTEVMLSSSTYSESLYV